MPSTQNHAQQTPPDAQRAVRREKYITLWAGVTFFMALIVVVWVTTVKQHIVSVVPQRAADGEMQWDAFLTEFQSSLEETKDSVAEVRHALGEVAGDDVSEEDGAVRGEQVGANQEYVEKRVAVERVLYRMNEQLASQ